MSENPIEKIEKRQVTENDVVDVFHQLAEVYVQNGVDVRLDLGLTNPVTKKVLTVDKWKKRQIERAGAAADDWLEGVRNPARDPAKAALDNTDKFYDKLETAKKEKRWETAMGKVTPADITAPLDKLGSTVFRDGVAAREAKIGKRVGELQPLVQAVSDSIQGMASKTDSEREKRLTSARKLMIEVGKKRRGVA